MVLANLLSILILSPINYFELIDTTEKLEHWQLELSKFEFQVLYRPVIKMQLNTALLEPRETWTEELAFEDNIQWSG